MILFTMSNNSHSVKYAKKYCILMNTKHFEVSETKFRRIASSLQFLHANPKHCN